MFDLYNRIAWFVSILSGFVLGLCFGNGIGAIVGFFTIFIVKFVFFSDEFIKTSLSKNELPQTHKSIAEIDQKSPTITSTDEPPKEKQNSEQDLDLFAHVEQKLQPKQKDRSELQMLIGNFFKENILAKLGAILVFLGVLFLMSLVWDYISSIGKICIGFIIGFMVYVFGVFLDKKGIAEGKILLGTGILINFLVILGGKYVLSGNESGYLLSTFWTLMLLVINTGFAVVTALKYKSEVLLVFGLLFAYLNPFLLGESSTTPYVLLGYGLLVSCTAIFIGKQQKISYIQIGAFLLGNILFFVAPFSFELGGLLKIGAVFSLALYSGFFIKKEQRFQLIGAFYVFFFAILASVLKKFEVLELSSIIIIIAGIFLAYGYSYLQSREKEQNLLLPVTTIATSIIFFMLFQGEVDPYIVFPVLILFGFSNQVYPFINKDILQDKNICNNVIVSFVTVAIFLVYQIFRFGGEFYHYIVLGLSGWYFLISIFAYSLHRKIFDTCILIAMFIFALGMLQLATIETYGVILLFQASALFFYGKQRDSVMYQGVACIFLLCGLGNMFRLEPYSMFYVIITLTLLLVNTFFILQRNKIVQTIFDILTVIGIILVSIYSTEILYGDFGKEIFVVTTVLACVGVVFSVYYSKLARILFFLFLGYVGFLQVTKFSASQSILFHYATTATIVAIVTFWNRLNTQKIYNYILNIAVAVYLVFMVSSYIYQLHPDTLLVTIFWGIIAGVFLIFGISKDKKIYRTIGLYYLTFVIGKIFFYDVWIALDNAVSRVVVFIILGVMLIFVSIKYSKKYGQDLLGEFDISELFEREKKS